MKPGIYPNMSEAEYHGDPDSLSASQAKRLLKTPAHFKLEQKSTAAMDLGSAVHSEVLGGRPVIYVDARTWSGKDAAAERDRIEAEGGIPLLEKDRALVEGMVTALNDHPLASKLLTLPGQSEVSMFWRDDEWDLTRRCRWDRLADAGIGIDLKTTSSDPTEDFNLTRAVVTYGYDVSAAYYLAIAAGLEVDIRAYSLIFVQSSPPHPVRVVELSEDFIARGEALVRIALERWRDCNESGIWPAYDNPESTTLHPPRWAQIGVPA